MPVHHLYQEESSTVERAEIVVVISTHISILTLFSYDYLLNLSQEVKLMWRRPYQPATILYFTSRYLPFVGLIHDLVKAQAELREAVDQTCPGFQFIDATRLLVTTAVIAVMVTQTYAFYNHSRLVLFGIGGLALALIIEAGFELATDTCSFDPPDTRFLETAISVTALTAFPTMIFALTVRKVYIVLWGRSKFQGNTRGTKLTNAILFQSLCMSGVCLVSLFNTLWYFLAPTTMNLGTGPFVPPVGAIFTAQFLVSLRCMSERHDTLATNSNAVTLTTLFLGFNTGIESSYPMSDLESAW